MEDDRVMKIERLMAILTVLQQNRKVTAPYLAGKFEVSRRTINRDIEDLCRAGIPIVTTQGSRGGNFIDGRVLFGYHRVHETGYGGAIYRITDA